MRAALQGRGGVGVWEEGVVGGQHQVWAPRMGLSRTAGQDGPGLPGCGSGKGDAGRDPQGLSWNPGCRSLHSQPEVSEAEIHSGD